MGRRGPFDSRRARGLSCRPSPPRLLPALPTACYSVSTMHTLSPCLPAHPASKSRSLVANKSRERSQHSPLEPLLAGRGLALTANAPPRLLPFTTSSRSASCCRARPSCCSVNKTTRRPCRRPLLIASLRPTTPPFRPQHLSSILCTSQDDFDTPYGSSTIDTCDSTTDQPLLARVRSRLSSLAGLSDR